MSKPAKKAGSKGASSAKGKYQEFLNTETTRFKDDMNTQWGKDSSSSDPQENPTYLYKSADEKDKLDTALRDVSKVSSTVADKDDPEMKKVRIPKTITVKPQDYCSLSQAGYEMIVMMVEEIAIEFQNLSVDEKNSDDVKSVVDKLIAENATAAKGRGRIIPMVLSIARQSGVRVNTANTVAPIVAEALKGKSFPLEDEIAKSFAVFVKLVAIDAVANKYPGRATINHGDIFATMARHALLHNIPLSGDLMFRYNLEFEKEDEKSTESKEKASKKPEPQPTNDDYE